MAAGQRQETGQVEKNPRFHSALRWGAGGLPIELRQAVLLCDTLLLSEPGVFRCLHLLEPMLRDLLWGKREIGFVAAR